MQFVHEQLIAVRNGAFTLEEISFILSVSLSELLKLDESSVDRSEKCLELCEIIRATCNFTIPQVFPRRATAFRVCIT